MRVTVCFGQTRVIVPCKGGATVNELVNEACARYKKAIGKTPKYRVKIRQLENAFDGGILDLDDYVYDVAEDRDQLIAIFDEEDDQTQRYNGLDQFSGSGSDGHRSPLSFQHHQIFTNRFPEDKSPGGNRERSKAPTGNATVIKHDKRDADHEVHVGADALKSGSNSNITVRGTTVNSMRDDDRTKSPLKKSSGYPNYYGRRESGSGQEEENQNSEIMITTTNSSTDQDISMVTASSGDNNVVGGSQNFSKNKYSAYPAGKKYNENFSRGSTRQSIMGMLTESYDHDSQYERKRMPPDGRKQNSVDLDNYGNDAYRFPMPATDHYLPPPPANHAFYPRFYNDSQEMFVDIDRRPLGIKVTTYREKKVFLGLLVESTEKDGRSEREGLLHEGDVIVEVNNYVLAHYSYQVAQEIFKDAMKFAELQLRVYTIEERERAKALNDNSLYTTTDDSPRHKHAKSPSIPVLSVVEPTPPKINKISAAKSLPNLNDSTEDQSPENESPGKLPLAARMSLDTLSNNTRKIGSMFEIELRKGLQGLGFSITTRDTMIGDAGPIYVKNILPKGAAIQDGRLRAGDRLLKVNDIDLTGHTQESAVNILRCIEVGSTVKLVVSRHVNTLPRKMKDDPVADKAISDDNNREYFKFEIALNDTGSAGLGISLKGNQSKKTKKDLGIFVKSVFHGGAAYQDGRLQANDQLISVNGQSLMGMTNHEAIDTLRTSMSTVGNVRGMIQMVIARRKASANEPLSPQFSSEASSEISDSLVNERSSRMSTEVSGGSHFEDDYFRYNDEIPRQIDPNPFDSGYDHHNDNGDRAPSPDITDPDADPFSRESIFRQSISEKRKGAAARDAQNIDMFKALKNKQFNSEKDKKSPISEPLKQPQTTTSTPLKWVKPTNAKSNHSTNSTPSKPPMRALSDSRPAPIPAKRNLNNSSNLPARATDKLSNEQEVQVGPMLGIAKSSSLESLQTAVESFVDGQDGSFSKAQPRVLRGRVLNESFRAALDQSYDMESFTGKPMATQGNGTTVSPLAKTDGNNSIGMRTQEKKRGGKSHKFFGIFRVGKSKRSISSDRNADSNSSASSSPRLTENEVHKKLLEAKREDDFKKHQAENERIQAKAKEMREQQEQKRKIQEKSKSRENLIHTPVEDIVRAPSVPVTAMQRMHIDPKVSYSEAHSGRRSVDPIAMRNSQAPTFDWQSSKRPTSPVDYSERNRVRKIEKKSSSNKSKTNPDYSSLPRKPGTESHVGALQDDSDGIIIEDDQGSELSDSKVRGPPSAYIRNKRSGLNGPDFNNVEFYNMQKPPASKNHVGEMKSRRQASDREGRSSTTQRKGRPAKPKVGRTLYYDDTDDSASPSSSGRSKTPQPQASYRRNASPSRKQSNTNHSSNGTTDFATIRKTFQREQSPEPPPVVMRKHTKGTSASTAAYRHSVHVDNPLSRSYDHRQPHTGGLRSHRQSEIASFWRKTRPRTPNHEHSDSDSYRTVSPSLSTVEMNRNAVKKLLDKTRFSEKHSGDNIVISPPYNL